MNWTLIFQALLFFSILAIVMFAIIKSIQKTQNKKDKDNPSNW